MNLASNETPLNFERLASLRRVILPRDICQKFEYYFDSLIDFFTATNNFVTFCWLLIDILAPFGSKKTCRIAEYRACIILLSGSNAYGSIKFDILLINTLHC